MPTPTPIPRRSLLAGSALAAGATTLATSAPAAAAAPRDRSLRGKVALITGGARGAGRSIALALAAQGADIALIDAPGPIRSVPYPLSTPEDLTRTRDEVLRLRRRCIALPADIRDAAQMDDAVRQTLQRLGRLDIVVANAGINNYGALDELSAEAIKDVIDVNLVGTAYTLRSVAAPLRKAGEGVVVVIGSAEAREGVAGAAAYVASKWGTLGLLKSFAQEMSGQRVRVVGLNPTVFRSAMVLNDTAYAWAGVGNEEELDALFRQIHSLDVGLLDPEDIARVVASLVSSDQQYVSATAIDVTAGLSAGWGA